MFVYMFRCCCCCFGGGEAYVSELPNFEEKNLSNELPAKCFITFYLHKNYIIAPCMHAW